MWVHHCNIFFWIENCSEHYSVTKLSLLICHFSVTNTQVIFRMYNTQVFSYHHKSPWTSTSSTKKLNRWQITFQSFINKPCANAVSLKLSVLLALLFHWDLQNDNCKSKGHNYTLGLIFTVKWGVNYNWLYQIEWSQADYQEEHLFFHHPDCTGSGMHLASYSAGNWCLLARGAWRWLLTSIWYRDSERM